MKTRPRAPAHTLRTYSMQAIIPGLETVLPLGQLQAQSATGAIIQAAQILARSKIDASSVSATLKD